MTILAIIRKTIRDINFCSKVAKPFVVVLPTGSIRCLGLKLKLKVGRRYRCTYSRGIVGIRGNVLARVVTIGLGR